MVELVFFYVSPLRCNYSQYESEYNALLDDHGFDRFQKDFVDLRRKAMTHPVRLYFPFINQLVRGGAMC